MKSFPLPLLLGLLPTLSSGEIILRKGGILVDQSLVRPTQKEVDGNALEPDPAGDDVALFANGDIMHGTFGGIDNGLLWKRTDLERPIRFGLSGVRQIVRKGGRSVKLHTNTSFFTLVSGDRIPGEIVSLNDQTLVIKSDIVGDLSIPRAHLKSISPNPFDGKLFYSGPYNSDGWVVLGPKEPSNTPESETEKKTEGGEQNAKKADPKPEENSPWIHSGASFYNLGSAPLAFPNANLPDTGRLRFRAEWKGQLNFTLALLSDFTRPVPVEKPADATSQKSPDDQEGNDPQPDAEEPKEAQPEFRNERLADLYEGNQFQTVPWLIGEQSNPALMFGSGYSLTLYSSYPYLSRNSFTEAGEPVSSRMSTGRSSSSLTGLGEADFEIRFDRKKGLITLYLNGDYAAQWNDLGGIPGDGTGFAILNTNSSARVKISEISITTWNGMKDSAQSMSHPERDVALMVNGTDRFSGELLKIENGVAHLKSNYLAAEIPVADISEIILKQNTAPDAEDLPENLTWQTEPLTVLYQPFGLIQLNPNSSDGTILTGNSPFLGDIKIDLTSSSLLRFTSGSPDLSDWFDDL